MHTSAKTFQPKQIKDMVPLYGQNPTELWLIFTLDFIYQRHHHRLESWKLFFYNRHTFRDMQMQQLEKVHLDRIDRINRTACICRSVLNEKVIKFQSMVFLNSLIISQERQ